MPSEGPPNDPLSNALDSLRRTLESDHRKNVNGRSFESEAGYRVIVVPGNNGERILTLMKGGQTSELVISPERDVRLYRLSGVDGETLDDGIIADQHVREAERLLADGQLDGEDPNTPQQYEFNV